MNNTIFTNVLSLLFLAISSIAYLVFLGDHVPEQYALAINFMLVPLIFGCVGVIQLKGSLLTKLIFLAALPLIQVFYFGADGSKPGLENLIALGEYIFIALGAVVTDFVRKGRWRKRKTGSD